MSIHKAVTRQLTMSEDDVRHALWHYLGKSLDQPMPDEADKLTVTLKDGTYTVSWIETSEVDPT